MKLLIGLGNPGERYALTRHNLGWRAVERFAFAHEGTFSQKNALHAHIAKAFDGKEAVLCALPTTFMNLSGQAVSALLTYYKLSLQDLLIVHDDLDLPLGTRRFAFDCGSAGHNGILSLEEHLGTRNFARLRLGIGRPLTPEPIETYVLEPFSASEETLVQPLLETSEKALSTWIHEGLDAASNLWNGVKRA